jgi:hypothetical protein
MSDIDHRDVLIKALELGAPRGRIVAIADAMVNAATARMREALISVIEDACTGAVCTYRPRDIARKALGRTGA